MIYYGVDLHYNSLEIVVLSEGFAHLESKYFNVDEYYKLINWVDSYKLKPNEICYWFFDDFDFNKSDHHLSLLSSYDENNKIYLVNHRKLINIIKFFSEWTKEKEEYYMMNLNKSFLLASSIRLFDSEYIKPFKSESPPEFEQAF